MRKLSNHTCRLICLILALIGLMSGLPLPGYSWSRPLADQATTPQVTNPSWSITGNLNTGRVSHTATLLSNGQILVAGGYNAPNIAEIYNPATNSWSLGPSMTAAREGHTATGLLSGRVLAAAGVDAAGNTLKSAEDRKSTRLNSSH